MSYEVLKRDGKNGLIYRFGLCEEKYPMPDLLMVQLESYKKFLQEDVPPEKREKVGLQEILLETFPVEDIHGRFRVEFIRYEVGEPRITPEEARRKKLTYSVPIWVTFRLVKLEPKTKRVIEAAEEKVYFCDIPYMTKEGIFIVNGVGRVVVNQIIRAPGVYYEKEQRDVPLYHALLVPLRGPWIDFTIDGARIFSFTISKRKKVPITRLLRFLGYKEDKDIVRFFFKPKKIKVVDVEPGRYILADDVIIDDDRILFDALTLVDDDVIEELLEEGISEIEVYDKEDTSLEVILTTLRYDRLKTADKAIGNLYRVLRYAAPPDEETAWEYIYDFFFSEKRFYLGDVGRYKLNFRLKHNVPEDIQTLVKEDIEAILKGLMRLYKGEEEEDDVDHLANRRVRRVDELLTDQLRIIMARLVKIMKEKMLLEEPDTIRVRKLINPRFTTAAIKSFFMTDRLSQFLDQTNPLSELTHKRRVSAMGRGGLTRQTAGIEVRDVHPSHYGRFCPIETPEGQNIGLITSLTTYATLDDYGFIRTPLYKVENGKVTDKVEWVSPMDEMDKKIAPADTTVKDGKLWGKYGLVWVRYRGGYHYVRPEEVDYIDVSPRQVISPSASLIPFLEHDDANRALMGSNMQRQAVPLLITEPPYVGTGMERKIAHDSGYVVKAKRDGKVVYADSKTIVVKPYNVKENILKEEYDVYNLLKFHRTNQNTFVNQKPLVKEGDEVKKGQVIADASATHKGELALGKNLLVAFVPWYGYNYEDAIVISERLVADDVLTSIHILEYEVEVRETKLGPEEVTRDLPNVPEDALVNLDKYGIVKIGSEVKPGDILVGKVTPRGQPEETTPEERLIQAIFGEKIRNVKDTSKRVPPGVSGIVVDVEVLSKKTDDPLAKEVFEKRRRKIENEYKIKKNYLKKRLKELLLPLLDGEILLENVIDSEGKVVLKEGEKLNIEKLKNLDFLSLVFPKKIVRNRSKNKKIKEILDEAKDFLEEIEEKRESEMKKLEMGDELPQGVLKLIKVYVAQRRKITVGDKLAGRHGNKGVIAKIAPIEDMPFLEDGTPVDIVLNPLGVPSRMNVGQILETLLGWVARTLPKKIKKVLNEYKKAKGDRKQKLLEELKRILLKLDKIDGGKWDINSLSEKQIIKIAEELSKEGVIYFATPVFEGIKPQDVDDLIKLSDLPENGKVRLRDGRTGEYFKDKVLVGYIYMMKLIHMVEDKIHARATGPYSLITQQPVGGKSHAGGQRFGEMEVWALEGYGASRTLYEMLTIKSDDVEGRNRLYEAILRGKEFPEPLLPESFRVLLMELRGLCFDIQILREKENKAKKK